MQKKYKKAFSLVELSIVILIVSILLAGALGVSKTSINNSKTKITKERMAIVYDAIATFVAQNKRLPCPGTLTSVKGSVIYGKELEGDKHNAPQSACVGSYISLDHCNIPFAYGMIPTQTLGLDPEMAEDGFGTKFSYAVDSRYTIKNTGESDNSTICGGSVSIGFELSKSAVSEDSLNEDLFSFAAQDASGASLSPKSNSIFILMSHGANKFGGFNASGSSQNNIPDNATDEEKENLFNCDGTPETCPTVLTADFNRVFKISSYNSNFDDIILFKSKAQLVRDAGLEFIMCNKYEAATSSVDPVCASNTFANNTYYDQDSYGNSGTCFKTCGKYGIWSSATEKTDEVYFFAYMSAQESNRTGSGSAYYVQFNTLLNPVTATHTYYDTTNGEFTAPVSGTYLFNYGLAIKGICSLNACGSNNYNTRIDIYLEVDGVSYGAVLRAVPYNMWINDFFKTGISSTTVFMQADKIARVVVIVSGNTGNTVDIYGDFNKWSSFSGMLLK
ncbi:MAG: prepilin-type N-terminal cleavage/methylation domain-containing protein [Rickettsiales bacterium]|jgi:prepilin-type N-terminal cleavage/methylation domain-containing protein